MISVFGSKSIPSSSAASSAGFAVSAAATACISSTFAITSLMSIRAKRISGLSVTLFPEGYRPKVSISSSSLFFVFNWAKIFSEVSGINASNREAPIVIASVRL